MRFINALLTYLLTYSTPASRQHLLASTLTSRSSVLDLDHCGCMYTSRTWSNCDDVSICFTTDARCYSSLGHHLQHAAALSVCLSHVGMSHVPCPTSHVPRPMSHCHSNLSWETCTCRWRSRGLVNVSSTWTSCSSNISTFLSVFRSFHLKTYLSPSST